MAVHVDVGDKPELADTVCGVFKTSCPAVLYPWWWFSLFIFCASDFINVSEDSRPIKLASSWCGPISAINTSSVSQVCQHLPRHDGRVEYSWGSRVFFVGLTLPSSLRQRFYWRGPIHHCSASYRDPTLRALQTAPLQALHHPQQRQGSPQSLLPRESIS